jgi:hypothetical protein
MASTILRPGDVITIASGKFEGYDRSGPFLVQREFDLEAFVREEKNLRRSLRDGKQLT